LEQESKPGPGALYLGRFLSRRLHRASQTICPRSNRRRQGGRPPRVFKYCQRRGGCGQIATLGRSFGTLELPQTLSQDAFESETSDV